MHREYGRGAKLAHARTAGCTRGAEGQPGNPPSRRNTAQQCQPHMPHIIVGRFHGGCLPCKHCLTPPAATSPAVASPRPYSFRARLPAPRRRALALPPGRTARAHAPIRPLHPAPTWHTLHDPCIQQHFATSAPALVRHVLGVFPRTSSAGRLPRA